MIFVKIDGHIHRPMPGPHPLRHPVNRLRAAAGRSQHRPRRRVIPRRGPGFPGAENLPVLAAIAVNRNPLAAQFVGQHISVGDVVHRRRRRKVDRLGYRVVRIFLRRALHPHVPFRRNIVRSAEYILHPRRHIQPLQCPVAGDAFDQLLRIETLPPRHCLKIRIPLHQPGIVHHIPHIPQRKQRLNPAGHPGDDADRPGRRDGGGRRITHQPRPPLPRIVIHAPLPRRKRPPPQRQFHRRPVRPLLDKPHHLPGDFQCGLRIVSHRQLHQQIGEPHHPQPDAPRFPAHFLDFGDWVTVHINHIVQQMHRRIHRLPQPFPIHRHIPALEPRHPRQVNRRQIA